MLQIAKYCKKTQKKNENVLKTCLKRVKTVLEAERTILYVSYCSKLQHAIQ